MSLQSESAAIGPAVARSLARDEQDLDLLAIDTIRTLAIDAVEKANSGHAGAPMAMAPVGYTLWNRFLRYDPAHPLWPNRDRFVLSAGHGSMLLYALLHLAGVERLDARGEAATTPAVSLEDIKNFRELGGAAPGHPEYGLTTGVETTTGPLGQGAGNSVGMAIAERWLAAHYNRPGATLFDYNVYALCSDGDLMEGVASEAASIAGHLQLSNLCWIWDDNTVTIEGHTELAFDEDVAERFRGYGWATMSGRRQRLRGLRPGRRDLPATDDRPTLIMVKSVIGYGSPHKQGTSQGHSDPLGEEEVKLTKEAYGWPEDAQFLVPDGVPERFAESSARAAASCAAAWDDAVRPLRRRIPGSGRRAASDAAPASCRPAGTRDLPAFAADAKGIATREASGKVLNAIAPRVPWLIGGSADLSPSTKTMLDVRRTPEISSRTATAAATFTSACASTRMGAVANGLALPAAPLPAPS